MNKPIETERYRLARIMLAELLCDGEDYEKSAFGLAHSFYKSMCRLESLKKYINNRLNKEETK